MKRLNKRYLNKGQSTKEIITSLGKIGISRTYYQHRSGGNSLFPLDEKSGVNGEILMPDVKEVVLFLCAYNTPEESSRLLEKCSFIKLHTTQVKKAITSTSEFIESTDLDIMDSVRQNEVIPESEIMVCSLDGVNVLLNHAGKKKAGHRSVRLMKIYLHHLTKMLCAEVSRITISFKRRGKKYHSGFVQNTSPRCRKIATQPLNLNSKKK